jgi:hypothetical protein
MESGTGDWLLLLGLGLAPIIVFAWRNDTLTGVVGVILSVFSASWLMRTIQAIDSRAAWSVSPVPQAYYYVLVAACVILALGSTYDIVRGALRLAQSRNAREIVPELPPATDTRICSHCGGTVSAQAIACKHCEGDLYPEA